MTADLVAQLAAQVRAIAATLREADRVDYDPRRGRCVRAALKRLPREQAVVAISAVCAVRLPHVPEAR